MISSPEAFRTRWHSLMKNSGSSMAINIPSDTTTTSNECCSNGTPPSAPRHATSTPRNSDASAAFSGDRASDAQAPPFSRMRADITGLGMPMSSNTLPPILRCGKVLRMQSTSSLLGSRHLKRSSKTRDCSGSELKSMPLCYQFESFGVNSLVCSPEANPVVQCATIRHPLGSG